MHVLIESAIYGHEINRKYRGCIPIHSITLLPAIEAEVVGSSVAAVCTCESLHIGEPVEIGNQAVRIEDFDLMSKPRASPICLSNWMPGKACDTTAGYRRVPCRFNSLGFI